MLIAVTNSDSYTGWYVGLGVGFTIVTVVVILVGMILSQASRIGHQALDGIELMDDARDASLPVWDLQLINVSVTSIWRSAEKARNLITEGR
jgi:hypothetical protein